jgi:hypothetical protein
MNATADQIQTSVDAQDVSLPLKDSVTAVCPECQAPFQTFVFSTGRQQRLFCQDACRQTAYRKSPAHRKCLDGDRNQRLNRRNTQTRRRNAFKYFSFDGRYSGPDAPGVPTIGMLNLKQFSKERNKWQ